MAKIKIAKTEKVEETKDTKGKKKKNKAKKNKISIVDRYRYELPDGVKQAIIIISIVLVVFLIFYLITVFRLGGFKSNKKDDGTTIQYQEILAGTSFSLNSTDYMVVFYDISDSENEDSKELSSTIAGYDSEKTNVDIYTCDLGNEFNKKFTTTENANTNPFSPEDLLINGPTLIRFTNGELKEYIQGRPEVNTYISDLGAGK